MDRFRLNMIAWGMLPTVKGDCPLTIVKKAWQRDRMVERMVSYLNKVYS